MDLPTPSPAGPKSSRVKPCNPMGLLSALKLRHRILLLVFSVVTGTLVCSLALVEYRVREHVHQRVSQSLQRSMTIFQQRDQERGQALMLMLAAMDSNPKLKIVLESQDYATTVNFLRESAESDQIFILTDAQGRMLLRSDKDGAGILLPGENLAQLAPVQSALQGKKANFYCWFDRGVWRMASIPLRAEAYGTVFTLTVGYRAEQNLVERVAREFDSDVALFAEGRLLTTNERCGLPGETLASEFNKLQPDIPSFDPQQPGHWLEFTSNFGDTQYEGVLAGLGQQPQPVAYLGILQNNREAVRLVAQTRTTLGLLGIVALIAALMVSIPVVGRVANPVELLETVVQTVGDGLIHITPDWTIQRVNLAAEKLLSCKAHELVEKNFFQVIQLGGAGLTPLPSQQLMAALSTGKTVRHEEGWVEHLASQTRFVSAFVIAPILQEGQTSGAVLLFRDITEIQAMRQQLLTFSHQAGMAEVATGTLHNVGNALNSVSVSASLVADKLRSSRLSSLSKTVAMLDRPQDSLADFLTQDPKGQKVPLLLSKLAQHLEEHHQSTLKELESMLSNLEHVKQVIKLQQVHTKTSALLERVDLSETLDSALAISQASSLSPKGLEVIKEYFVESPILLEKHKLVQILVNLCCNALESMAAEGEADKKLLLRTSRIGNKAHIEVQDSGGGIAPENLSKMFTHGFTTKPQGHGFGLHNCSLAARSMGGRLSAQSPGLGKGATFVLELPLEGPESTPADPDHSATS